MFDSFRRSWQIAKESFALLRKDPELMIFPIISFIAGVVVAGILAGVGFGLGLFGRDQGWSAPGVLLLFLFYLGTYFLTIYFQVALVASVKLRLSGGNPNLSYGIAESNKRLTAIVTWAIIAAIVGLALRLLEDVARRNTEGWGRIVASIVIGMIGMAWSLATFFVIPVIAYEGLGGIAALKRSGSIIKARWGEAVVGQAGIGLVMIAGALVIAVVFGGIGILSLAAGGALGLGVGILFIAAAVLGVLALCALASTLNSIYVAVLYNYATGGKTGGEFSAALIANAFQPGGGRRGFI